jgi:hypothetical protein
MAVSCGSGTDANRSANGMNQDQAKARIKALVTQALQFAAPDLPGEVDQDVANRVGYCSPPDTDKVAPEYAEHLPAVPSTRYHAIAAAIEEYWKKQGFQIYGSDIAGTVTRVFARTPDGVDMEYVVVPDGSSWMRAHSPCVTPTSPPP